MFVSLAWLTSNHMFGLDNFEDKSVLRILKILNFLTFYLRNFKTFKKALSKFISNCHPKHLITSTNIGNAVLALNEWLNYSLTGATFKRLKLITLINQYLWYYPSNNINITRLNKKEESNKIALLLKNLTSADFN